jgi:hypothetical protein
MYYLQVQKLYPLKSFKMMVYARYSYTQLIDIHICLPMHILVHVQYVCVYMPKYWSGRSRASKYIPVLRLIHIQEVFDFYNFKFSYIQYPSAVFKL